MTPINPPATGPDAKLSAGTGAAPEWQPESHDSEIFLIRNGPIHKGVQAGILFPGTGFEVADINQMIANLNEIQSLRASFAQLELKHDCLLGGLKRISAMRSKWSYEKISSYRESNNTGDVEQAASEMESNYFADVADEILKTYSTI